MLTSKPFPFHPNLTGATASMSGALSFYFDCTLISPRVHVDVTSESLRFQFRVKSFYLRFNSRLTLLSLQIRVTCNVSNSLEIRFVSNLSIPLRFHFAFVFTWSSHQFRLAPLDTTSLCVFLSLLRFPRIWCAPTSPNRPNQQRSHGLRRKMTSLFSLQPPILISNIRFGVSLHS